MTAVLLDVDGTLVNSTTPVLRSLNAAFEANGLPSISEAHLPTLIGPPLYESLAVLLRDLDEDPALVPKLVQDFRSVYVDLSVDLAETYPGVTDMLAALHGGVRLGVVTSKPKAYAIPILERLGFASSFEAIEGPGTGAEIEPKVITLARTLAVMDLEPSRNTVLLVGDRAHDVDAAKAHGVGAVGVLWGFGTRHELTSAGADEIIEHPRELVPLVDP